MTDARRERLEETALQPLASTGRLWYAWVAFLLLLVGTGMVAYAVQLRDGLGETGLGNQVMWGVYITNFVFFIGISHAGTLISAILRVSQAEWRRPVTRMAEVITAVALMVGGLMPVVDLGRPDRIPNLVLHGRLQSPIVWDLISVTTYLTGSLIYLYLPLIPDIALARDRLAGRIPRWRLRVYRALALGWRDTPGQRRILHRTMGVMMILIIPIAISVHTVVSWIFAMTLRTGWNSTIFGPYFVVGAIFSGIAGIITVMYVFRRVYHLEEYITEKQFHYLGYLLAALGALYLYFTLAEYLTPGYKLTEGEALLLDELMLGNYAIAFWTFVIMGAAVPVLIVALPFTRTIPLIVAASVLVNVGMWIKRFIIVVPSLSLPLSPSAWGAYTPTWVEVAISVGALAGFALIFTLFAKLFPIISAWEIREGWERQEAAAREAVAASHVALSAEAGVEVAHA